MLLGIIKDTTHNIEYYINAEQKDNLTEIGITRVDNDTVRELSKEEIKDLAKTLLSSKMTFKEKYKDYDVYLDEANNKRYFKNGMEDFFMFLTNNGVSAINYINKINKKADTKRYSIMVSTIVFDVILSTAALIPFAGDVAINKEVDTALYSIEILTEDELVDSIQSSKYLTDEEKQVLCNEDYFKFVLENSDKMRNYSLKKAVDEVKIQFFNSEVLENADGYHDHLHPNTIYVLEDHTEDEKLYYSIIIHEFIHSTQSSSGYSYVIEASDEMFKYEFYNKQVIAYPECVKRLKVLMEIIGPEPIIDCNFQSDPKNFEKAINEYLSPEDAKDLLKLFKTPSTTIVDPNANMSETNKLIDEYLAKMYYNKTGENIENNAIIQKIYTTGAIGRYYFNYNSSIYNNDYILNNDMETIGTMSFDEFANNDLVDTYIYTIKSVDENDNIITTSVETTNFSEIPLDKAYTITAKFKDKTRAYTSLDSETNTWREIKHERVANTYEPAIPKKFPEQIKHPTKIKEIPGKVENEVKTI